MRETSVRGFARKLWRPRWLLAGVLLLLLVIGSVLLGRRLWARHELQAGRAALERYHANEARPHLEACLRLWSNNAEALLLMARAARRAGILEPGDYYLDDYERRHGQTEELVQERIFQTAAKGDVDRVHNYCRLLVKQNSPAAPLAMEAMVQGYLRQYRLHEGYTVLHLWLEREPENTQALLFHAGLHAMMHRHDESSALYRRILELDPEHDTARLRLATLLMERSLAADAEPYLELLRQRQPHNPMVAVLLIRCRDQLRHQAEAESLLKETLAEFPHFPLAVAERGRLALRDGRLEEAEACLREALAQKPDSQQTRYHLIQCLYQSGRTAEAEEEKGRLDQLKIDAKRIEKITTEDIPKRPHDPELHHELARLLFAQGNAAEAVEWLHRALAENAAYEPAHWTLAEYYKRIGDEQREAAHRRFLPAKPTAETN